MNSVAFKNWKYYILYYNVSTVFETIRIYLFLEKNNKL